MSGKDKHVNIYHFLILDTWTLLSKIGILKVVLEAILFFFQVILPSLNMKRKSLTMPSRWVSVVEFHDPTLGIGKVFGQESTVVQWNYQILGLHQVTVHQKLGVILVIEWFKNWCQQKMLFTKKVRLNWYSSMKFIF